MGQTYHWLFPETRAQEKESFVKCYWKPNDFGKWIDFQAIQVIGNVTKYLFIERASRTFGFFIWEKQIFMIVMRSNITKWRDRVINYYFPHQMESTVLFRRQFKFECLDITKELPTKDAIIKKRNTNPEGGGGWEAFFHTWTKFSL